MAYEFTKAHPGLSVTVFDLPAVVEMSEHFHPLHTDNRISFVAGQFVYLYCCSSMTESWLMLS